MFLIGEYIWRFEIKIVNFGEFVMYVNVVRDIIKM